LFKKASKFKRSDKDVNIFFFFQQLGGLKNQPLYHRCRNQASEEAMIYKQGAFRISCCNPKEQLSYPDNFIGSN
jgi:hypothetical protein